MCGIVGYVGPREAKDVLIAGLTRLEYRGYDSAGIAVIAGKGEIEVLCNKGKIADLVEKLPKDGLAGHVGIGHTRWATHGVPSERNSHPHRDCTGKIAVVHNGIIENYVQLREQLIAEGHVFTSETDSEVVAHLLEKYYDGNLRTAMRKAVAQLKGAYGLAAVHSEHPEEVIVARCDSPIIIGLGKDETVVASDIPAIIAITRDVVALDDDQIAIIAPTGVTFFDKDDKPFQPEVTHVNWDVDVAERGGYPDFFLKEINEQPRAIYDTLQDRVCDGVVELSEFSLSREELAATDRILIIGCGTSYHAGLVAKELIQRWARIPVEVCIASEFKYSDPIITPTTLIVAITQSGETADVLGSIRQAKAQGAKVFAITNVVGSRAARESDGVVYTKAGPEISVAATKSFTSQLIAVYILALFLAQARDALAAEQIQEIYDKLRDIPHIVEQIIATEANIERCAAVCDDSESSIYVGRGIAVPIAMEGALKVTEVSYVHSFAYPAGELKHGPIALLEDGMPVVVIALNGATYEKTLSNIQEIKARGATVIAIATEGNTDLERDTDYVMYVPEVDEILSAIPAVIPLQIFARAMALRRGRNIDQPRNLAKSVTVE